jgi:Ni,Fe-hydrogenase III small subunit
MLTGDFELAARRREDLVVRTWLGSTVVETPAPAPAASALGQRLSDRIRRLLRRSLHIRHMDAGSDNSTDWEISALLGPVYDIQRLGIDVVASPRHADLLLVTGAVTRHLEEALRRTYEAMPAPRLVVAAGAEACGGGILQGSYAVRGGVDLCLPVDVYIPGDPPRPQALIHGLLIAMDRLEPRLPQQRLSSVSAH